MIHRQERNEPSLRNTIYPFLVNSIYDRQHCAVKRWSNKVTGISPCLGSLGHINLLCRRWRTIISRPLSVLLSFWCLLSYYNVFDIIKTVIRLEWCKIGIEVPFVPSANGISFQSGWWTFAHVVQYTCRISVDCG